MLGEAPDRQPLQPLDGRELRGRRQDRLAAARPVGRLVHASEEEHPDLLWALKGGGGNVGVVTAFEDRAHPHGPEVYEAKILYPVEQGREVLARWRDAVAGAPDEVTTEAAYWTIPAAPHIPAAMHGAPVLIVAGHHAGPVEDAREALAPLARLGTPLMDASAVTTYLEAQRALDPMFPAGRRYYRKGLYLDRLDEEAIDLITDHALQAPSPHSPVVLRQLGGAMGRVPETATAVGDRSAPFHLSIDAGWDDPAHDRLNVLWARELFDAARRFGPGRLCLDFAGTREEGDAAVRAGGGRNHDRLVDVKTAYDPENVFRLNPDIAPRPGALPGGAT